MYSQPHLALTLYFLHHLYPSSLSYRHRFQGCGQLIPAWSLALDGCLVLVKIEVSWALSEAVQQSYLARRCSHSCTLTSTHILRLSSLLAILQLSASSTIPIMEALGGVASAITVLTLALQSTKVIYEVVSSISHGSDDIDRLARATSNLQKLLENTKQLAEHVERTKSMVDANLLGKMKPLLGKMKPLLDQCADDLGEVSRKLSPLQRDSKDRRWKKAIKHAKVYLDTKGATDIWNVVNHYVEFLGTCLGNVSV